MPVQVLAQPTVLPFARALALPRPGSLTVREVNRNRGTRVSTQGGRRNVSAPALRMGRRTVV